MNSYYYAFALIFLCFTATKNLEANDKNFSKIYIHPEQIHLEESAISVYINDNWEKTHAIYKDKEGFYIKAKWPWTPFYCSECGRANEHFRIWCYRCDRLRDDWNSDEKEN